MYVILYFRGELGLMYCVCDLSHTTTSCHVIVHRMNAWMVLMSVQVRELSPEYHESVRERTLPPWSLKRLKLVDQLKQSKSR